MEPVAKKACLEEIKGCQNGAEKNGAGVIPAEENGAEVAHEAAPAFTDLSGLEIVRVLGCRDASCSVALEATHADKPGRILLQLQKTPFDTAQLDAIVSGDTQLSQLLHNDVYSKHLATLPPHLNKLQATLIQPATDQHFARYEEQPCGIVEETPQLYLEHSLPYIEGGSAHSVQWIYNILDGSSEADRVICRHEDPLEGFVLLPDLKWTGEQTCDLYCQALVQRRDLRCLRDLRGEHLPLLRAVASKGKAAIESKYGVSPNRLRVYLHYLPSFYHLHIHFAALSFEAPGTWAGRAHLISDVISNLEIDPQYYAKATLSFTVKDSHPHPLAANKVLARQKLDEC